MSTVRNRASAGVELCFNNDANCGPIGIGLELLNLGNQLDRFKKFGEPRLLRRRHVDCDDVSAEVFDQHFVLGQLLLDAGLDRRQACRTC